MIFAADHVSDRHIPVIYHHAEVIGRGTIGTANDQIVQFLVAELDRSADLIVKNNRTFLRVGETHDARLIVSMVLVAMAAAAIVTRLLTLRHLLFAQRFQTLFRAIAFVSGTGFQHLIDYVVITIETFGLEIGAFVPLQIQPVHAIHDGFNCFRGGAFEIGVFNTQHKLTAVVTGKKPGIESSTRTANVQIAGWAWREASFDFHELALRLIKMPIAGNVRWKLWVNILTPWADSSMLFPSERHGLPFLFINHAMAPVSRSLCLILRRTNEFFRKGVDSFSTLPIMRLHTAGVISSAGRAPPLQGGGRRFDPVITHHYLT